MTTGENQLPVDLRATLDAITAGDKRAVARFFNVIEDRREEPMRLAAAGLDELHLASINRSHVIGITGPPGAGKSSLLSRLIQSLRARGHTVGILAIDPSSRVSHGALLGDRIRLQYDSGDPGVFVRSMANRGEYGGVSDRTLGGITILRSAFDIVFVETVGVGQSESDIARLTDTTLLVIQPGSGDVLQYLKAGIMETPHLLVVNKSDHPESRRTFNDVLAALGHVEPSPGVWRPEILLCSAAEGTGIEPILEETARHRSFLAENGGFAPGRAGHAAEWLCQTISRLYGTRGLARLGGSESIARQIADPSSRVGPFHLLESLSQTLESIRADSPQS